MGQRQILNDCRRIVIKIGTSTLTHSNGQLNLRRMSAGCGAGCIVRTWKW